MQTYRCNFTYFLHPFQSANIIFAGKKVGVIGAVHPIILKRFGIKNKDVFCFEVNLDDILIKKRKGITKNKCESSSLLPIIRDFSVIVDGSEELLGKTRKVRITKAQRMALYGEICE